MKHQQMHQQPSLHARGRAALAGVVALGLIATVASCSDAGSTEDAASSDTSAEATDGAGGGGTVTLVTHDSFGLSDGILDDFTEQTGYAVETVAPGDGGTLVNQLVLTKDSPLGDAVFGVDNSYASRAVDEGVFEPYRSDATPDDAPESPDDALTPIDQGDVCINADLTWFEENDVDVPATLDDLTDPEYADLLVVTNPATSSPGLAFLAATVGAEAEGWEDYWAGLRDNGVKVVDGWEDAYYVDFTGAGGEGDRPLVLSYATSPAFTVTEDGSETTTAALLDTCFRQVEYAGVLAGAENPEGAKALVDFLLSDEVQSDIPGSMYMYPVTDVELPAEWEQFAPLAEDPFDVDPAEIAERRSEWIDAWTATVIG
ncbi:thiamine ABC transporter substrate-binding protein [Paraoerskovia sediminicola]|uniref:Thiamine ABC transporter substrate-binding protein n=1 Tax=Paraoerskovia sediminicola TaxID=1138587 RepID=A0ABM8G314_9CELL|nr:thiamine ABC transporter substrate-binding protein [Paraoerskovia sediminicola]BDZ42405.1 thiamine ABC transporter substrate-binding protein [Paraoerskovia sediminicola]